jgi:methylenetetrahydrofolate dehydrogenase (NADP+)/methenyltetrahydrofolate cyclohydrolase
MKTLVVNGHAIKTEILARLKEEVRECQIKPVLAVIFVGKDEASKVYINEKKMAAEEVGAKVRVYHFPETVSETELISIIHTLSHDQEISGILVQLPLPKNLRTEVILRNIPLEKDVDHLRVLPNPHTAVAEAVLEVLDRFQVSLEGQKIVVVGKGLLGGQSIALALKEGGGKPILLDGREKDLSSYTKEADVLITSTGVRDLITGEMVKEEVVIVDIGTTAYKEGDWLKTRGDVNRQSVLPKARLFTPVPGGVGPITVAVLVQNLVRAAQEKKRA